MKTLHQQLDIADPAPRTAPQAMSSTPTAWGPPCFVVVKEGRVRH